MNRPPPHVHGKEGVDGFESVRGLSNPRSRGFFVQNDLLLTQRAEGTELWIELSARAAVVLFCGPRWFVLAMRPSSSGTDESRRRPESQLPQDANSTFPQTKGVS
jgi:hypothetical protein